MIPTEGFIHKRETPGIGDFAIFDFVSSKFPGLIELNVDMSK